MRRKYDGRPNGLVFSVHDVDRRFVLARKESDLVATRNVTRANARIAERNPP